MVEGGYCRVSSFFRVLSTFPAFLRVLRFFGGCLLSVSVGPQTIAQASIPQVAVALRSPRQPSAQKLSCQLFSGHSGRDQTLRGPEGSLHEMVGGLRVVPMGAEVAIGRRSRHRRKNGRRG